MKYFGSAATAICLSLWCSPSQAAIPEVLLSPANQPPSCATPGRLMAFVKSRNPALRARFQNIAVDYMRLGEALNIRWDFAFFQMLLETASLKFNGDVHWSQNNFAGLGATGGGVKGERFASVSDGVRAHLEHLLIYAGVHVDNPIADRTRKVQAWKILNKWQRSIRGAMTFGHIGQKWAPGDRGYAADIKSISDAFYSGHCRRADPQPDLLAQARRGRNQKVAAATTPAAKKTPSALTNRASLGASTVYRRQDPSTQAPLTSGQTASNQQIGRAQLPKTKLNSKIKVLNRTAPPAAKTTNSTSVSGVQKQAGQAQTRTGTATKSKQVASAGHLAAKFATPWLNPATRQNSSDGAANGSRSGKKAKAKKAPTKCRVWTASYGGQKAIIIKSADTSHVNYTVLDVNAGRERQEAAAYIAAYAQGGKKIGEFKSQTLALDKAFKLCPEG